MGGNLDRDADEGDESEMILSVSRRTDVPNYYSEWFYNRIKEGFLYVRNPMNAHQISRINLLPEVVDCMVFWTKNPENMLARLDELKEYSYYFQFTLTGYGRDVEPGLPDKRGVLIPVFRKLAGKIGAQKVIWRYDPIFVSPHYTPDYHLRAFEEIAGSLADCTRKVVISFVDMYAKIRRGMEELRMESFSQQGMLELAGRLAEIAGRYGMETESCAERIDLQSAGVRHGSCVDKNLIEEIIGCKLMVNKDRNQRTDCGCYESVEVGTYHTCRNGCRYCYANFNDAAVKERVAAYDAESPLLCGRVGPDDRISERKMESLKDGQMSFWEQGGG